MTTPDSNVPPLSPAGSGGEALNCTAGPVRGWWRRTRWRRRLAVAVLLLVFHAPLLRAVGGFLVVGDAPAATDAVVLGGDSDPSVFDDLARMVRRGDTREVLVFDDRSSRLVRLGIVPAPETVARREMAARGVAPGAITVLTGEYPTAWAGARRLRGWMESHPESRVVVVADQFGSRGSRHLTRRVLGPDLAARVSWWPRPDPRFDPSNWWRSRQGVVAVGGAYVALTHAYLFGEPPEAERWDPDRYESQLRSHANPE